MTNEDLLTKAAVKYAKANRDYKAARIVFNNALDNMASTTTLIDVSAIKTKAFAEMSAALNELAVRAIYYANSINTP